MTGRRVLRHVVPVDDKWHRVEHADSVVHVDCREADVVEFWATEDVLVRRMDTGAARFVWATYEPADQSLKHWEYRVFGTGHEVDGLYVGTALSPGGGTFVWHLFRREVTA